MCAQRYSPLPHVPAGRAQMPNYDRENSSRPSVGEGSGRFCNSLNESEKVQLTRQAVVHVAGAPQQLGPRARPGTCSRGADYSGGLGGGPLPGRADDRRPGGGGPGSRTCPVGPGALAAQSSTKPLQHPGRHRSAPDPHRPVAPTHPRPGRRPRTPGPRRTPAPRTCPQPTGRPRSTGFSTTTSPRAGRSVSVSTIRSRISWPRARRRRPGCGSTTTTSSVLW